MGTLYPGMVPKEWNRLPRKKRCKTCKYKGSTDVYMTCDYLLIAGHARGCPVEGCTRYERGKKTTTIAQKELKHQKAVK